MWSFVVVGKAFAEWLHADIFFSSVRGTWNFFLITGNAGTGCTGEAQVEHGCDFVPVAGRKSLYTGILSAPYR